MIVLVILTAQFILVSCLFDEISTNYIFNNVSIGGKADLLVTQSQDTLFGNRYFDDSIIDDLEKMNSKFIFLPQLLSQAYVQNWEGQNGKNSIQTTICGLDWEFDSKAGLKYKEGWNLWRNIPSFIGNFVIWNENITNPVEIYSKLPSLNHCIISRSLAKKMNNTRNDKIEINLSRGTFLLTIDAIVENQGRLPDLTDEFIITNLSWLQIRLDLENKVNLITGYFLQPEEVYDLRDLDHTAKNLHSISQNFHEICDDDIEIIYPKLMNVNYLQTEILNLSIISTITKMVMILIYAIYLLSISKPVYSELILKLQKFQKKNPHNFSPYRNQLLFESILISFIFILVILIGVILGYLICYIFGLSHLLSTILRNFGLMGIMSIIVVFILQISSKDPKTVFNGVQESSSNNSINNMTTIGSGVLFLLLIIIAFNIPEFITSMDSNLISLIMEIYIFDILMGLFIIQYMIYQLIRQRFPLVRRWKIIRKKQTKSISKKKKKSDAYHLTIMFLILSSGFIGYLTAFQHMKQEFAVESIKNSDGSDIILKNTGYIEHENYMDMNLFSNISANTAIDAATPIYSNNRLAISQFSSTNNNFGLNDRDLSPFLGGNTPITTNQTNPPFEIDTMVSNYGFSTHSDCAVIGINRSYLDVIDFESVAWDNEISNQNPINAFDHLFESNYSCFLSKSIAQRFGINEIDSPIILTIINPSGNTNNSTTSSLKILLSVVGILENLPGFNNFYSLGPYGGALEGVLLNVNNFFQIFNISQNEMNNYPIEKIMMSYNSTNPELTFKQTLTYIRQYQENYSFIISEPYTQIEYILHGLNESNIQFSTIIIILTLYCALISRTAIKKEDPISLNSTRNDKKLSILIFSCLLGIPISFIMIQMTSSIISSFFFIPLKLKLQYGNIFLFQFIFLFLISIPHSYK